MNLPFIIIAGDEEIENNELTLKVMATGEQKKIPLKNLKSIILSEIRIDT